MSSQAQLDANRLNSQKSTGPTSPEGKAVSSLNALKSGIDADSEIIHDEDPAALEALSAAFHLEHHPAGATQIALVDTLVSAEWTERRLRRVEADLWKYRVECLDQTLTHGEYIDESIQHNHPLGKAYHGALDAFTRIQRRIDGTNRLYLRTLKVLQDLQSAQCDRPGGLSPEQAAQPEEQTKPVEPAKSVEPPSSPARPPSSPARPPSSPARPPSSPARPPSSAAAEPATPASEPPSPVESQPLIPPIGFVPHFANATGKRQPVSHENPGKLKIGQWANGVSSARPKGSRPGKGHRP